MKSLMSEFKFYQDKIRGKIAYVKMSKKHMSPTGYNFVGDRRIVEISTSYQSAGLGLSTGAYVSMNFVYLILCF